VTPDSTILSVITGTGVTGVFVVLFLIGWIYPRAVVEDLRAERDALKAQLKAEQERAEAAVAAAQATRDVFTALQAGARIAAGRGDAPPAARRLRRQVDLAGELLAQPDPGRPEGGTP
jgi:regulator of protease activity HflC (stomatin/prohibitin superfamily)